MINHKILNYAQLLSETARLHQMHKTIIFVHGIFNLLHSGHVTLLKEAKKHGDVLIVGVEPDSNTKIIKGPKRPIHSHEARLFMISELVPVDLAFLIPNYPNGTNQNNFYRQIYQDLKPDVVVTCVKAGKHGHLKKQHADEVNAKFIDIDSIYEKNTSKVIEILKTQDSHG